MPCCPPWAADGAQLALDLVREGVLEKYGVEMIGASREAIDKAEDRDLFRQAMKRIGLEMPKSAIAHSMEEALQVQAQIGFRHHPTFLHPGRLGGGIAYNREEFEEICERGLDLSPTNELLIEESILGWKEYEMEVVRRPQGQLHHRLLHREPRSHGVHTGDSITVAPAQTLTDKEYQIMRDASLAVLREIGVDTGGSNVQFAIDPENGRMIIIEMKPAGVALLGTEPPRHRFPHRQGGRPSWRWATPWTSCERDHRRRHPGFLRAHHRLWSDQGAALRLRKIPRGRRQAHHPDEVGGRR